MGKSTDPLQFLSKRLTGNPRTTPPWTIENGVVINSTDSTVDCTIEALFGAQSATGGQATFTATYEKRLGATPAQPPAGTPCLLLFAMNPNSDATKIWAVAFDGWPT